MISGVPMGDLLPWLLTPPARPRIYHAPLQNTRSAPTRAGSWFPYLKTPGFMFGSDRSEKLVLQCRGDKLSSYIMTGAVCGFGKLPANGVASVSEDHLRLEPIVPVDVGT